MEEELSMRSTQDLFTELQHTWEKLAEGATFESSCRVGIATKAAVVQTNDEIEIL